MWKILVADDEAVNRKLLIEILAEKATCEEARDGKQTLEAYQNANARKTPFDLILLDIAMPDIDGIGVLKRIREFELENGIRFGKGIPIIMVTAYTSPFMKSFKEGADDYILKPVDPNELLEKVEKKLGQKNSE